MPDKKKGLTDLTLAEVLDLRGRGPADYLALAAVLAMTAGVLALIPFA